MEKEHPGVGSLIQCPSCKSRFSPPTLEQHYKDCITAKFRKEDNKRIICDICGKSMAKSVKWRHQKIHMREQGGNSMGLKYFGQFFWPKKFRT